MPNSPTEKQKPPSKSQATKSRLGSEAEPARNKSLGGNSVPNETKSAKSQDSQNNRASRARSSQRTKSNANWDSHDQRISTTGMSQGSNALSQNGNLLRKTDVPPNVYHKPGFQAARYNTIYSVIQRFGVSSRHDISAANRQAPIPAGTAEDSARDCKAIGGTNAPG